MAITDLNGDDIKYHEKFPNDKDVNHLEIGAGKTAFGKKFFPNCYLTERKDSVVAEMKHFSELDDYNEDSNSCHFIDKFNDLEELSTLGRKFNKIICCNPYEYGFGNLLKTIKTLNSFGQLLIDGGEVLILGNNLNKWAKRKKFIKHYNQGKHDVECMFSVGEEEVLDQSHQYIINHEFFKTCMQGTTTPTYAYSLTKNT